MARELSSTKGSRVLLDCAFSNPHRGDLSLVSHVELWSTSAKVFDTFGADIEVLDSSVANSIGQLSQLYDEWHNDWQPVLSPLSRLLGRSSRLWMHLSQTGGQIIDLCFSAAKLHLFAHIFRGPAQRNSQPPISLDPRAEYIKFAGHAVQSALDYLNSLTSMLSSGRSLETLPAYLKIMTAFSSVFLLRIMMLKHNALASENDRSVFVQTIERLCGTLQKAASESTTGGATNVTPQSPVSKITDALRAIAETMHRNVTNDSRIHTEYPSNLGPQERNLDLHDAHGVIAASDTNFSNIDDYMDFDFNFLDWDNAGEQTSHVDLVDETISAAV